MPLPAVLAACRVRGMQHRRTSRLSWTGAFLGIAAVALALAGAACRPAAREYELEGQVVAVDPARQELTIRHQDISGFMPGMTMAFKVRDPRLMNGRAAGELVTATLVVDDAEVHLRDVARTGFGPVVDPPPATRVMDLVTIGPTARRDADRRKRRPRRWRTGGDEFLPSPHLHPLPLPDFCP